MFETFSSSAREHERIFPLRTLGIFVLWLLLLFRVVDGVDKNVLLWFLYFFLPACKEKSCYRIVTEEPMSTGKKSKQRMKT